MSNKDKNIQNGFGIRTDVLSALSGADQVRLQLLSAIDMGASPLSSYLYAIKSRVKNEESLIKKVISKKENKSKSYSAFVATDIIGLRLLCLYSQELPEICERFLSFVKFAQSTGIDIFPGVKFSDCIKEAIVFKIRTSSKHYDKCYKLLKHELGSHDIQVDLKSMDDDEYNRRYSSVHIVLKCNCYKNGRIYTIPLEVQIRTALEDVWGEIQHQTQYKFSDEPNSVSEDQSYTNTIRFLNSLKSHVDSASEQADYVKYASDDIVKLPHLQSNISSLTGAISYSRIDCLNTENLCHLSEFKQPLIKFEEDVRCTHMHLKTIFDDLRELKIKKNSRKFSHLQKSLLNIQEQAKELLNSYHTADNRGFDEHSNPFYYLKMEIGSAIYWKTRIELVTKGRTKKYESLYENCLEIYENLKRDSRYKQDFMIDYRLSQILLLGGEIKESVRKVERALNKIKLEVYADGIRELTNKETLDLWYIIVGRHAAFVLWRLSELIRLESKKRGRVNLLESLDHLQKAINITCESLKYSVDETLKNNTEYRYNIMLTLNNLFSYAWYKFLISKNFSAAGKFSLSKSKIVALAKSTDFLIDSRLMIVHSKLMYDLIYSCKTDSERLTLCKDFRAYLDSEQNAESLPMHEAEETLDMMKQEVDKAIRYFSKRVKI